MSEIHDPREERLPSRGVKFFDTKFSPVKFLTVDDDRGYEQGTVVFVGGESKVYGPYQLDTEIGRGNGVVHWKAFAVDQSGRTRSTKPPTKDQLEQENASLLARIAEMEAKLNSTDIHPSL